MSHIFEALQRAEAERSGVELDACDLPAELLQMAESAARAEVVTTKAAVADEVAASSAKAELEEPAVKSIPGFESLPVSLLPYSKLISVTQKDSLAAEKFRFLAVRLRHLQQRRPLKKLLITSTMPEEGKSMVSANLACTLASRGRQKTLLIEGDLRRPALQRQLGFGRVPSLCDYLHGNLRSTLPVYRLDALGIWIVPGGQVPDNPLELMQSGRLSALLEKLSEWFEWIVIDSPPVLPLADTSVWSKLADGILLVTRQGTTDKDQLKRGLEALESGKLIGALVNSSDKAAHSDYYQHYGAMASNAASDESVTS